MVDEKNKRTEQSLSAHATEGLQDAVGRGLQRRARRARALGRTVRDSPPPPSSIVVGARPRSEAPSGLSLPRRPGTLVPGADSDSDDDDSNEEWEEHVDVDERTARRAVNAAKRAAASRAAHTQRAEAAAAAAERKRNTPKEPSAEELATAEKKAVREHASRERARCQRLHDAHTLLLLAGVVRMDTAADSPELQAFALSVAPPDALPSETKAPREALARFALWARGQFRSAPLFTSPSRTSRPVSQEVRAHRVLSVNSAHVHDTAVALAAALRADGARVRIVVPIRPYMFEARKFKPSTPTKKKGNGKKGSDRKQVVVKGDTARAARSAAIADELRKQGADSYSWLEVWCDQESTWLPLDFVAGFVDVTKSNEVVQNMRDHAGDLLRRSQAYVEDEAKLKKSKKAETSRAALDEKLKAIDTSWLARIVAVEHGVMTDVTRRYVSKWKHVEKERSKGKPLQRFLVDLSRKPADNDPAAKAEEILFDELAENDDMPTSVAALHKHPRYILERHLKKYETVHPRRPVGHLKDEPIYLRSHVQLLHSRERWTREMRRVRDGAVAVKHVKSIARDADERTPLFGMWQTDALLIPPVVDGKVPRGERGNLELWTPAHLPVGAAHVKSRFAMAAARALSIDYVQAMTGFDVRSGRSVPRIEGVVVAEEYAEAVYAAAAEKERVAEERAEAKAREEACARWKALLKAMIAREKVRKKYGGVIDEEGTFLAMEKRKGEKRALQEKLDEERSTKRPRSVSDGEAIESEEGSSTMASASEARAKANEIGRSSTSSKNAAHKHEYVEREVDSERGIWVKRCATCKLEVAFEKL